jgi:hypothetical protein
MHDDMLANPKCDVALLPKQSSQPQARTLTPLIPRSITDYAQHNTCTSKLRTPLLHTAHTDATLYTPNTLSSPLPQGGVWPGAAAAAPACPAASSGGCYSRPAVPGHPPGSVRPSCGPVSLGLQATAGLDTAAVYARLWRYEQLLSTGGWGGLGWGACVCSPEVRCGVWAGAGLWLSVCFCCRDNAGCCGAGLKAGS